MPKPDFNTAPKHKKRSSRSLPLIMSAGFLALATGAFALTLSGLWIWLGALAWAFAGLLLATGLIRSVSNPTPQLDKMDAMRSQLRRLDHACENLQDQNWELREAEQKYRALLNRQGDIILHLSDDGSVHYANSAFDMYFDASQIGTPFLPDAGCIDGETLDPVNVGTDPMWERQIDTLQGPRWFRWTETLMRSTQKDKGLRLLIARDITAFKKVEAASKAKSRFLATISHEMRTPLNGIIGMATLLESTQLTAEQGSYSQALRQSSTALLALVNDVLDLSRIEAGKFTLSHEWASPARLMEDVVELLAPDAQEKGLSVASWIGQDVPAKLLIDAVRVRQILVNLLGNAIKFTQTGAINLSLDCKSAPEDGEMATILLSVRDTGPGIADDLQDLLFEEFEQADTTRTRHHEGTGLGLAISRRLARMMNGDILLSSVEGKGSTFTLELSASWINEENKGIEALTGDSQASIGDMLVGIDLTEADRRALYSYCQDWSIEFRAYTLAQWQEVGQAIAPDHLLINGANPDKAAKIIAGFDPFRGGSLTRPLPQSRIILLEPGERHVIAQMRDCGISAYLVKPMRQASLRLALLGHPSGRSADDSVALDQTVLNEKMHAATPVVAISPILETERHDAKRILLVEDNEINALLARKVLLKAGMDVSLAQSGTEALALYETGPAFDLALLDLHMPDMDGMTLFDALEQLDTSLQRMVPKLAFTADALEETRQSCLDHGFSAFIVKPVEPQSLVNIIEETLRKTK
ncbi:ATP-binding protein [Cohaesibacter celericrescens]|uniref:histidine kinase n=1 Tax=Cohaesibacter celericrescens TaxID=2067669 RepID=A0A2N5XNR7_9HYPH|nr:ATP-binding protein [Cohaesibacter celericrescens]PLW76153.1 hypothetical protein C0081_14660 [Cohaesibacter celericrescens]